MGWNTGYAIFESTVIGAYDLGRLDKELLAVLLEPYRYTDIDSGGSQELETKDGKNVMEVVIQVSGKECPVRPDDDADDEVLEAYWDKLYEVFSDCTKPFGW